LTSAAHPSLPGLATGQLLALYALSLGPSAAALLAWQPATRSAAVVLPLALGLAAAALSGAVLEQRLPPPRDKDARRALIWIRTAYGGLALLSLGFAVGFPRPELLARQTTLHALLQVALLLLPGLAPGRILVIANALVLAVLAAFFGGALAALAVVSWLFGLAYALAFENFHDRLAAHVTDVGPLVPTALRETTRLLLPVALGLGAFLALVPPAPHLGLLEAARLDPREADDLVVAYTQLAIAALVGATAIYYVTRLLRRKTTREPGTLEWVDAEALAEELVPEAPAQGRREYLGTRGAIVRAYVRLLAAASGTRLRRRPEQTPREIANELKDPAAPLQTLTSLFAAARYGPGEPSETQASNAQRAASEIQAAWSRPAATRPRP
jgi:hypothetical protein